MISSSPRLRLSVAVIAAGVALASCSSSPSSSTASTGGGGAGGNGAGRASSVKACNLLTLDEIKQATGATNLGAGVLQTTDTQADCEWNAPDSVTTGATGVGLTIQDYDDSLWQTMSSAQNATPVTGIGEKAYKGYPHSGDLAVKQGAYEVDVAIIDFTDDKAKVDDAAMTLMKLALPRL